MDLWDEVATLEDAPSLARLGHPPHLTLIMVDDGAETDLGQAVRTVFDGRAPLRIVFDRVCYFENPQLVLWAAPQDPKPLHALHQQLQEHVDPRICHIHYRSETWVPHCTLGMQIQESQWDAAMAFASEPLQRFEVVFDTAEWVSVPPIQIEGGITLEEPR